MFKTAFLLFYEFFKIGLFSIGGGYAVMPFLYYLVTAYDWYTSSDLLNILAIANMTPGPVGINMATFAGFKTLGIVGSIISTMAIVLPSLIIVIIIAQMFNKFKNNEYMQKILYTIKISACGLLVCVFLNLSKSVFVLKENIDYSTIVIFIILCFLLLKYKLTPVKIILLSAALGVVVKIFV